MQRTIKILIPLILIGNTGCALFQQPKEVEKLVYVTTPLPLPNRPILPTISLDEMKCLSPTTLEKLKQRDIERRQYTEELEVIIKSTHNKK